MSLSDIYDKDQNLNLLLDMFLWRERDARGNGFDFFVRVVARAYESTVPNPSDYFMSPSEMGYVGLGGGARYIRGVYRYGILWQAYVSAAYQYVWVGRRSLDISDSPFGIWGGLGIEVGFTPYFGVFGEVDYGYNPVKMWGKTRNLEGLSLLFGASFRTAYSY